MNRLWLLLMVVAAACYKPASISTIPQPQQLGQIRTIYIEELGAEDGSDLVREKIRLELSKTDRFTVVERPDQADAVLRGTAGVASPQRQGTTRYSGTGVLRLVERETERTVWVFEYIPSTGGPRSVSTKVAQELVTYLLRDARGGGTRKPEASPTP
jgi:hypothetical protein